MNSREIIVQIVIANLAIVFKWVADIAVVEAIIALKIIEKKIKKTKHKGIRCYDHRR